MTLAEKMRQYRLPLAASSTPSSPTPEPTLEAIEFAKAERNQAWELCPLIPSWVDKEAVSLDRIFTRPEVAVECKRKLFDAMREDHADVDDYHFVDPGAGNGAFFDTLPNGRRVGIDVVPGRQDFVVHDYLTWQPPPSGRRYAVLGNPPFGYRAWLALAFVNHSASFADYIGFVLPMAFQSDGKGSPKHRVRGAELIVSEQMPPNAFVDAKGRQVKLNALWQIWRRGVNNPLPSRTCEDWVELFTVDTRKERLCGQDRLKDADWFLQRTFFGEPPSLVRDFADVRYGCGYGIVLKDSEEEITALLQKTDWRQYSNLAVHNCRHISMYHIRQAVIDGGFVDG